MVTDRFFERRQFEFRRIQRPSGCNLLDRSEQEDSLVRPVRLVQPVGRTVADQHEFLGLSVRTT